MAYQPWFDLSFLSRRRLYQCKCLGKRYLPNILGVENPEHLILSAPMQDNPSRLALSGVCGSMVGAYLFDHPSQLLVRVPARSYLLCQLL